VAKLKLSLPPLDEELAKVIGADLGLCPRCGRPIDWVEHNRCGGRVYVYAVHETVVVEGGRRKRFRKKCYLGPVEDYVQVSRTHSFSLLSSFSAVHRELSYLQHLASFFEKYLQALEKVLEWLEGVEDARDVVENLKSVARYRAEKMLEAAQRIESVARRILELVSSP